jgi:hypothetical protein
MGASTILDGRPAVKQAGAGLCRLHTLLSAQAPRVSAGYSHLVKASQGEDAYSVKVMVHVVTVFARSACTCMLQPAVIKHLAVLLPIHDMFVLCRL